MGKNRKQVQPYVKSNGVMIGIRFGDNDFYNTMMAVLRAFIDSKFVVNPENIDKASVVKLFNMLAPGMYWLCQNGFTYCNSSKGWQDEMEHIASYLCIKEKDVYIGEECVEFAMNGADDNFYYVDIDQKQVFSA